MKVELNWANDAVHFIGTGSNPIQVSIDGSPGIGGLELGARPMELLLMSLGGCSAIDLVLILKKQRQRLKKLHIEVEGVREQGKIPTQFKEITITYRLWGDLDEKKVTKAVDLALDKYCSVRSSLHADIVIHKKIKCIAD